MGIRDSSHIPHLAFGAQNAGSKVVEMKGGFMTLHKLNPLFAAEFAAGEWAPAVDILENEREIVIKAELPGIELKDVAVTIDNNVLTLKGERHVDKDAKKDNFHRMERAYGVFARSFALPEHVDASRVTAEFKVGLLTVTLPKSEAAKSRSIEIKAA
jgi:HSP20 family protein